MPHNDRCAPIYPGGLSLLAIGRRCVLACHTYLQQSVIILAGREDEDRHSRPRPIQRATTELLLDYFPKYKVILRFL